MSVCFIVLNVENSTVHIPARQAPGGPRWERSYAAVRTWPRLWVLSWVRIALCLRGVAALTGLLRISSFAHPVFMLRESVAVQLCELLSFCAWWI